MILIPKEVPQDTKLIAESKFKPVRTMNKLKNSEIHDKVDDLFD